ncbi:hypothetical protein CEUSTIGMA_g3221.t1 [Chlamydomonas eustigma]|uniref:Uncharacterized protein n=1 Tax=Chlamydomonas eustigma TaxID=1157962 RepID=A0A250WY49_9CHLO|nr:hypothetical protein CEUSTIGMA_g3221.t1 [Chlamydomonas eustigma]|eukprot:GAX75778.1 hypothetical protein CEUSTIGMA_g3221.t1 [Chlamydomonas eustigma]
MLSIARRHEEAILESPSLLYGQADETLSPSAVSCCRSTLLYSSLGSSRKHDDHFSLPTSPADAVSSLKTAHKMEDVNNVNVHPSAGDDTLKEEIKGDEEQLVRGLRRAKGISEDDPAVPNLAAVSSSNAEVSSDTGSPDRSPLYFDAKSYFSSSNSSCGLLDEIDESSTHVGPHQTRCTNLLATNNNQPAGSQLPHTYSAGAYCTHEDVHTYSAGAYCTHEDVHTASTAALSTDDNNVYQQHDSSFTYATLLQLFKRKVAAADHRVEVQGTTYKEALQLHTQLPRGGFQNGGSSGLETFSRNFMASSMVSTVMRGLRSAAAHDVHMRADEDVHMRADEDVHMRADEDVHMRADEDVHMRADEDKSASSCHSHMHKQDSAHVIALHERRSYDVKAISHLYSSSCASSTACPHLSVPQKTNLSAVSLQVNVSQLGHSLSLKSDVNVKQEPLSPRMGIFSFKEQGSTTTGWNEVNLPIWLSRCTSLPLPLVSGKTGWSPEGVEADASPLEGWPAGLGLAAAKPSFSPPGLQAALPTAPSLARKINNASLWPHLKGVANQASPSAQEGFPNMFTRTASAATNLTTMSAVALTAAPLHLENPIPTVLTAAEVLVLRADVCLAEIAPAGTISSGEGKVARSEEDSATGQTYNVISMMDSKKRRCLARNRYRIRGTWHLLAEDIGPQYVLDPVGAGLGIVWQQRWRPKRRIGRINRLRLGIDRRVSELEAQLRCQLLMFDETQGDLVRQTQMLFSRNMEQAARIQELEGLLHVHQEVRRCLEDELTAALQDRERLMNGMDKEEPSKNGTGLELRTLWVIKEDEQEAGS